MMHLILASRFMYVCTYLYAVFSYVCIVSCIESLFLVFVNLHNNVSCRDLMTAVVDFMFFPESGLLITLLYQVSTTIKSISHISVSTREPVSMIYLLDVSSFDTLFYFPLFCFLEDEIENRGEICSICRSHG